MDFFNKWLYIHNDFVNEKWVNCSHISIDEKHIRKDVKKDFRSV